ncbi:carboxypeptidase-like regulatory domain-containing protein [Massilia sp. IC2-477]|uniref:carboxypeptidase-like regulatory domain-containing protein n=1 Tax=Massilia sp. IC2-477 TaxID=2887198 RepID=UPI001D11616B|nr:carboxypeptidase-like regulatory domain-containing protein [Massilia sp. IC2-477]MCC2956613.1 carboxypeptidase-like regulatory domain-containing protein [Massilia sp. IC2-477]
MLLPALQPEAAAASSKQSEDNLILLEVRLGNQLLSDAVTGYEIGRDVYLPLGEVARLLTLAIRVTPGEGRASGYIISESRGFSLDVPGGVADIDGRHEELDRSQFKLQADEIYVASKLLSRWLPLDLELDMSSLALKVRPREQLPLQARLERRKHGSRPGSAYVDPGYPRLAAPYRLAGVPVIDQTLGLTAGNGGGRRQADASYTAYLTTDLLGMEAALYASSERYDAASRLRLTLGRHDPEAGLLGPLHARTALFGSVPLPGVSNISSSSPTGNGVVLSNRPLNQPTSFDRHTLQGALPPGWDVELYYNDALVGVRQSGPDGKYSFEDQPLAYGPNEFRLVFHGPLGQLRVERQNFLLEQSAVPRGALYYDVGAHRDGFGRKRAIAQFEWGLSDQLNAVAGWQRVPSFDGAERSYANLGLRGYWNSFIATADAARADDGGTLAQLGLKTRLGPVSVSASHARLDGFTSDFFHRTTDPVRSRDEVRADGVLGGGAQFFPLSLQLRHDRLASSTRNLEVQGRISAYRNGFALTNALRWQRLGVDELADGQFQVSRRVAGVGLTGQLQYLLSPETTLGGAAVSADYYLHSGYLLTFGLARSFKDRELRATGALNKSLGSYGLGINGYYSNRGEYGLGMQFFMAMGLEPRSGRMVTDAQPMANMGAASIRVFLDKDLNGIMDGADEAIPGAGFTVNGSYAAVRTDASGIAYLPRLLTHHYTDIALDRDTLEDPQWQPRTPGVRIVPRPGNVSQVEFAVNLTGEVDGTTYLYADGKRRAVGDLKLELVDASRKVVASMSSAADGYYVISGIFPGEYFLRVSPEQLKRLGLTDTGMHIITIGRDGTVLNARDLDVRAQDGPSLGFHPTL